MTTAVMTSSPEVKIPFLERTFQGRSNRLHLKEFGLVFGIFFLILCGWSVYRHNDYHTAIIHCSIGLVFALLAYAAPLLLWPLWKVWMAFGHVLGIVMNTVILTFVWMILLLPFAVLLKIIGKRVMDTTFRTGVPTYYESRPAETNFQLLKRQF